MRKSFVKCATRFCRNKTYGRKYCSTCRSKKSRTEHPELYCFVNLRNNAKRRGIEFKITFDQFKQFAYETKYLAGKGRQRDSLTIDRIDNSIGYVPGNLQAMTKSDNSRKGNRSLIYDYQTRYARVQSVYNWGGGK
jgi:hypothetical protein